MNIDLQIDARRTHASPRLCPVPAVLGVARRTWSVGRPLISKGSGPLGGGRFRSLDASSPVVSRRKFASASSAFAAKTAGILVLVGTNVGTKLGCKAITVAAAIATCSCASEASRFQDSSGCPTWCSERAAEEGQDGSGIFSIAKDVTRCQVPFSSVLCADGRVRCTGRGGAGGGHNVRTFIWTARQRTVDVIAVQIRERGGRAALLAGGWAGQLEGVQIVDRILLAACRQHQFPSLDASKACAPSPVPRSGINRTDYFHAAYNGISILAVAERHSELPIAVCVCVCGGGCSTEAQVTLRAAVVGIVC